MTDMDPAMYRGEIERIKGERDVLRAAVEQLRTAVHRVETLLDHARLVSPSPSMTVYVTEVEAALAGDR